MTSSEDLERRKKATEDSIDSLGKWMIAFTAVVVAGLVIEYNRPFIDFLKTCDWRTLLGSIGGLLVTGGVAGELFVEFKAHRKEKQLRGINLGIDAEATDRLKAADERIANAQRDAAEANERAATAVLELEKFKADRIIPPERWPLYINSLRAFAGQKYTLSVSPLSEAIGLLTTIDELLKASGWIWTTPIGQILVTDRANQVTAKGIAIRYHPSRASCDAAGASLTSLLEFEGFPLVRFYQDPMLEANAELSITVGSKL